MKIAWKKLEVKNESCMMETLEICKSLLPRNKKRFITSKFARMCQFIKVEFYRIRKVYSLFLMSLVTILLSPYATNTNIILLYYLMLGSYFIFQLYEFRNYSMDELLATLLMNETKLFFLKMCSFLSLHLISFSTFAIVGYLQTKMNVLDILQLAIIPLFMTQGIMLFLIPHIRNLQLALTLYFCIFFLLCTNLFPTGILSTNPFNISYSVWILLIFFALIIFLTATAYYVQTNRKRRVL